jgi:hypothetical protein
MLPWGSPAFSMVSSGDMKGLLGLLRERKASLQDRDLGGTPLIHVSIVHFDTKDINMLTRIVCSHAARSLQILDPKPCRC